MSIKDVLNTNYKKGESRGSQYQKQKFISVQNMNYLQNQRRCKVPSKLVHSPYLDEFWDKQKSEHYKTMKHQEMTKYKNY